MVRRVRPTGRGPRIRDDELDQMVALYNQGKSFISIAKAIKRNPQTVRKYTLRALKERPGQDLRREVLKESLVEHYRDLVNALGSMTEELQMPEAADLAAYGAPAATGPDLRTRLLIEGLREGHIRESPLWDWWDGYSEARKDFGQKLATLSAKVKDTLDALRQSFPKAKLEKTTAGVMTEQAISPVMGAPLYSASMLRVIPSRIGEGEEVWLGERVMLASGPGMTKLTGRIESMMSDMSGWPEISQLVVLYKNMSSLRSKIEEEVEVLRLRRAFPGHCRLCPV
jgi:hypothetical protein